jgi:hypothetical protein
MSGFARRLQQGAQRSQGGGPVGTNYFSNPSAHGYPDATNTGPVAGTSFTTYSGTLQAASNTTYQNLIITGGLLFTGVSNVTVINCKISGQTWGSRVVYCEYGSVSGIVIRNCDIDGGHTNPSTVGVAGDGYTLDACNIHGTTDAIDVGSDCTVQNCYVHDLQELSGDHTDGLQSSGGGNYLIQHNTIDANGTNSAIFLGPDQGNIVGVTVHDNILAGGGYTMYGGNGTSYTCSNEVITNNRFVRDYVYGPTDFGAGGTYTFTGNVWDDDNTLVPSP